MVTDKEWQEATKCTSPVAIKRVLSELRGGLKFVIDNTFPKLTEDERQKIYEAYPYLRNWWDDV